MAGYNGPSKEEKEREKRRTRLVLLVCCFIVFIVIMIVFFGVSNPHGLEGAIRAMFKAVQDFLKELRFKLDVYFRFFQSIFNR